MTTVGIVTGAGRGMGLACAQRLAGRADVLFLVDRDAAGAAAAATRIAEEYPERAAEPVTLDVADPDGVAALADRVAERGTLRAVAHAAGISPTMGEWRRIVTVDLVGTALLIDALRPLSTTSTATVCFASMAPLLDASAPDPAALAVLDAPLAQGFPDLLREVVGPVLEDPGTAYAWAKRGVQRLVRREAVRLGGTGARICSVSPGIIDTPQGRREAEQHPSMAQLIERTPLRRTGSADDVAAAVAFLLSPDAAFVNGIDVPVDGGVLAAVQP